MRVASAGLTGIAAAHAHLRRLTAEQAVAEMRQLLARWQGSQRQQVLDEAAAQYTAPGPWHEAALAVLVQAGADPARAAEIWSARPQVTGLGGLGEDGGGKV